MNDFATDLSASMVISRQAFWTGCYSRFFPNYISSSMHDEDLVLQAQGIDRKIFLQNGTVYGIDEKVRYKWYGDLLIEEYSSIESGTPGWIERPLRCDYIAYAVLPLGKCFFFQFPLLQHAWQKNKTEWKKQYRRIEAINQGYTTVSWAIPLDVVYYSTYELMTVNFKKYENN